MNIRDFRFDPRFTHSANAFLVTGKPNNLELDRLNRDLLSQNKTGYWIVKEGRIQRGDVIFVLLPNQSSTDGYPRELYGGVVSGLESFESRVVLSVHEFFFLMKINSEVTAFLGDKRPPQGNQALGIWKDDLEFVDEDEGESIYGVEGRRVFRMHRKLERNKSLIKKKKDLTLKQKGRLACEVCGFDFEVAYGSLGRGFCEVHHITPLSSLTGEVCTKLDDLAVLCANCHRAIHRSNPMLSISQLTAVFRQKDLDAASE